MCIRDRYERYLTNTEEVEVTDRMIEGLLLTMIHEGPRVIADPDNYQARANIMWAGMMAHNNSCGVGRTQDWTSHNIEHELSALYDCAHGAGSVSYTHLDVYKRQGQHTGAKSCMLPFLPSI